MRPSNTIKLKLDDKLFKYVPFKGVFTYLVKEVRSYSDNEQYEIECQDCSDHTKCRLLVCQVDNSKTFQYVAILNDEDEKQYYWHNDQDRYFYQSKKECKLNEGQNLLTKKEKEIKETKKKLEAQEKSLKELEVWINEINKEII